MVRLSVISLIFLTFCSCNREKPIYLTQEKEMLINSYLMNISYGMHPTIDYDEQMLLDTNIMNLISFKDLFNAKRREKLLIFRYDTKSCNICLNQEMLLLSKLHKNERESVILLVSANNVNEFKIIREKYKDKLSVYVMKEESSVIPEIDKDLLPYYFLAEQDKPLKMVFIPDKNMPYLSKSYLNYIFANYIK